VKNLPEAQALSAVTLTANPPRPQPPSLQGGYDVPLLVNDAEREDRLGTIEKLC
jgi:hypothetical protein